MFCLWNWALFCRCSINRSHRDDLRNYPNSKRILKSFFFKNEFHEILRDFSGISLSLLEILEILWDSWDSLRLKRFLWLLEIPWNSWDSLKFLAFLRSSRSLGPLKILRNPWDSWDPRDSLKSMGFLRTPRFLGLPRFSEIHGIPLDWQNFKEFLEIPQDFFSVFNFAQIGN